MGKIKKLLDNELVGGTQSTDVYPVTSVKAVYDENNERLDNILNRRGVVNISTNYNDDHIAEVLTLEQAIAKVPSKDRVLGFQGNILTADGWITYKFIGTDITQWSNTQYWAMVADSSNLAQELGNSETNAMSQKAVTEVVNTINDNNKETTVRDSSTSLHVMDSSGCIVLKIDSKGLSVKQINICDSEERIIGVLDVKSYDSITSIDGLNSKVAELTLEMSKKVEKENSETTEIKDNSNVFQILDGNGNVVIKIDSEGLKSKVYNICNEHGDVIYSLNKSFFDSISGKSNVLNYQAGISKSFGEILDKSAGVTNKKVNYKTKHGTFSHYIEINNNDTENYVILDLNGETVPNTPFGFWMWINPFDQLNVDNFKAQIVNDSGYVQAQIYNFGNALYSNNSTLSAKQINTLGGWIYITIFGNAGTKLKLIFKSTSVNTNEKIATIYVDGQYYIGKKITPVFVINGDGFYNNEAALGIYEYIESKGLVHSVCGTCSESEQMPNLMKTQINKGILEMGAYGGQDGQVIAKGTDYATMITSCQKIIGIDSQETEQRIPPILYGCQFHKLTPLIFRVVTDCGFKVIKGGGFGYYSNSFQQIFDHAEHTPIAIMPTGFTGSGNDAEFLKQQAKNWIDRTINCGTLGVLFNHNYSENPALESDSSLYTYTEVMRYIIDYLTEQKAAGKCLVLKPTELYENLVTL